MRQVGSIFCKCRIMKVSGRSVDPPRSSVVVTLSIALLCYRYVKKDDG